MNEPTMDKLVQRSGRLKMTTVFFVGLILALAIIFNGLANRYSISIFTLGRVPMFARLDKLTGQIVWCTPGIKKCDPGK